MYACLPASVCTVLTLAGLLVFLQDSVGGGHCACCLWVGWEWMGWKSLEEFKLGWGLGLGSRTCGPRETRRAAGIVLGWRTTSVGEWRPRARRGGLWHGRVESSRPHPHLKSVHITGFMGPNFNVSPLGEKARPLSPPTTHSERVGRVEI